ncbi:MAG TPA: hypothetical protein DGZ24_04085 [Rhodospirillaceae bacterium]|nr:hypothetical protein [Rhodospirillaceae bacterium]
MSELKPISASFRRLLVWTVGLNIPGWGVIILLGLLEHLEWTTVGLSCAAIFVLMAVLVFSRLADFDKLIIYAENMIASPNAAPPVLEASATAGRLLTSLSALRTMWTDQRNEVAAIAKSLQEIIDSLPDPLLLVDTDRRLIGANAAAENLFEINQDLSVPSDTRHGNLDLARLIRDPRILDAADKALGDGNKTSAQFSLPSPVERTFSALLAPLPEPALDGTALIIVMHDLTERLKMDRMRADFVANASHELRTPLASVLGFTETLLGPAKNDLAAYEEFLDIILKQANRMNRLIDDLLSLSRIELREHTRPTESVNLEVVLRNAIELLEGQANESGAQITLDFSPSLPPAIADPNEISQVFHNLITNAIKYGGEGGRVDVTSTLSQSCPPDMPVKGPCLKVSVRDEGDGISKEFLPRLTERFYRVDTARSRSLGGTGLGLAIVKHIMSRHRGALQIDSEVGIGSTFSVYIPAATARPPPQEQ